jgi:lipid-A-disaccharide synthase
LTLYAKTDPITIVTGEKSIKIFFSAAEASGDDHAAGVIRQLLVRNPQARISGLGGPKMEEAGCKLLENMVDKSAMLLHVMSKIMAYYRRLNRVKAYLHSEQPDMVVVVDSFAWNIHVAKAASNIGIPVLFYVAPQFWAWAPWRIKKLKKTGGKIACILPFEQQWFQDRGVDAEYVGHPLFQKNDRGSDSKTSMVDNPFPKIALLPGSRSHEISYLWPAMLEIAQNIKNAHSEARFFAATNDKGMAEELRAKADPLLGVEIRQTSIDTITSNADLTLVASGTATLQVAAQHCPMIVMYHVHPIQWHLLGRWLLNIPHLSLVNILAQRELVPEFMPFYRQTRQVSQTALDLLGNNEKRDTMRSALKDLTDPLKPSKTSHKVVDLIMEMLAIDPQPTMSGNA